MNTAVYLLRAKQIGLTLEELDQLSMGMVLDLFVERHNDDYDYKELATQSDFDGF